MKFSIKYWYLFLLCCLFVTPRLFLLRDNAIPFTFDHGKDSIAILDMWLTHTPKLIGPWTSIPGLFFGPAWYYLLLPSFIIGGGNPVAPVVVMVLLGVAQILLAYRYFGKSTATIIATSQTWMTVSQSAWNPFPMTALTLCIAILFKKILQTKHALFKLYFFLGITASLGFHFSTAFAVFYVLLIPCFFLLHRVHISLKSGGALLLGFALPFLPQALFEVRHSFLETRAVLSYLIAGGAPADRSWSGLFSILSSVWGEISLGIFPGTEALPSLLAQFISVFVITTYALGGYWLYKHKKKLFLGSDALVWFLLPTVGFVFLHYNVWYVLGMTPLFVVIAGQLVDVAPRQLRIIVLVLFLMAPLGKAYTYLSGDAQTLKKSSQFLPVKLAALSFIRADAAGRPFASYHFVPDVYDYSYQYLYFFAALGGQPLPAEFSYAPGKIAYIPEKADLLPLFEHTAAPEKIYFIVEKPEQTAIQEAWWNEQKYSKIIHEEKISPEVTVFVALP